MTYNNILDTIGNTPIVELAKMDTGLCRLFVKLENQNPGGSIKDRIGLSMINAAEEQGKLKPGGTIIEATAGNTGIGLALVARMKGYNIKLVIPDKMSQKKINHLRAMGVEIIITRSDVGKGHPDYYQDLAVSIAKETGAFYVNQFENPANPLAHQTTTGPEIWEQMDHDVDAIVVGVGSSGTMTGLTHFFKNRKVEPEMILADPKGSVLAEYVNTGRINSEAGSSSGTLICAALKYCREQTTPKKVVTFVCDNGNKYLSKMYNDYWLLDQGLYKRKTYGDLRDIITRRFEDNATIFVSPDDTLNTAYCRMKLYDISQIPVLTGTKVVGIVDESDLLLALYSKRQNMGNKIEEIMTKDLITIKSSETLDPLIKILNAGLVAIIEDKNGTFQGLITKIDLINYLNKGNINRQ